MTVAPVRRAGKPKRQNPGPRIPSSRYVHELVLRGKRVTADVAEGVLDVQADIALDRIGEITIVLYDPQFRMLRSGLLDLGGSCDFHRFYQEVTVLETGEAPDGLGQVTLRCRAAVIGRLKRRRGTLVMRDSSPSEFVIAECKAVNARHVVQPSPRRRQVARDTKKAQVTQGRPSSFTTFERLARELGYVFFESGGTVFFGQPSWLRKRDQEPAVVKFGSETAYDAIGIPSFSDAMDSDTGLEVTFEVPRERIDEFMPGDRVRMNFEPWADEVYLVKALRFPIAGEGNATVTAGKPLDPKPQPPERHRSGSGAGPKSAGAGGRTDRTLGRLLREAGFEGQALATACGVAIAESGVLINGRQHVRAKVLGDTGLVDNKWGPSVGVFQIRSLKNPFAYSGTDRLRVRSKLTFALYNAKAAHAISNGGRSWGAWSTYNSGAYRQYVGHTEALVDGWEGVQVGGGGGGGGGTSVTGRKSAHDFVELCLRQAGDTYIYGAEANLSDPNPNAFDCSELIQWAAHRVGCYMPDGSSNQLAYMTSKGTRISVEAARATRGAILWIPGHVAVSLGGNRGTIEATNRQYGVRVWGPGRSFSWQAGGRVPGMRYG